MEYVQIANLNSNNNLEETIKNFHSFYYTYKKHIKKLFERNFFLKKISSVFLFLYRWVECISFIILQRIRTTFIDLLVYI